MKVLSILSIHRATWQLLLFLNRDHFIKLSLYLVGTLYCLKSSDSLDAKLQGLKPSLFFFLTKINFETIKIAPAYYQTSSCQNLPTK